MSHRKYKKCYTCGELFFGTNKYYCSSKCRGVKMSFNVGERSPAWKGGKKAAIVRRKQKYPDRIRAYRKLRKAVKSGRLMRRKSCSRCEAIGDIHAHHPDYTKPLDVVWLCRKCHRDEHMNLRVESVSR